MFGCARAYDRQVVFHYDNEDVPRFGTYNNRLEYYETFDTGATPQVLLSTTYYYYWCNGNPNRVVTHVEGTQDYSAVRFEYARNGTAVTHVLGETWDWDGADICESNNTYDVTFAREFRYDAARQRYYNAVLDQDFAKLGAIQVESEMWSDYHGDDVYGDYTVAGGSPPTITDVRSFEPGLGRSAWSTGVPGAADYYHANHLGTTRFMTNSNVAQIESSAFTAFGDRINGSVSGPEDRYGYKGRWGYQGDRIDEAANPEQAFPYLHVGARYYDPAVGRFLQRDPVSIMGGSNVYAYVVNRPTNRIDPSSLGGKKGKKIPKKFPKGPRWTPIAVCGWLAMEIADRIIAPAIDNWADKNYRDGMEEVEKPFDQDLLPPPPVPEDQYDEPNDPTVGVFG